MLIVTPTLQIPDEALDERFVAASGPGGQNVNKTATAVELRFDVRQTPHLPGAVRERLERLSGHRLSADGILIIKARRYRTQEQNRAEARQRLCELIRRALVVPKGRRATRPPRAAHEQRLTQKRQQSLRKRLRARPSDAD